MKKWNVIVTMNTTVSTEIEVIAETAEAAQDAALGIARANPNGYQWELDEGNATSEPYIGGPGAATECVEP